MVEQLKQLMPDYAKDVKLNLSSVLTASADVSDNQIAAIALSVAYATKSNVLIQFFAEFASEKLDENAMMAAKSAATIMAMNNIYYRFIHLVNDEQYSKMPANLRMNVMMNPGIDKKEFELLCLAVSAVNGCGMCMESHTKMLEKVGVSKAAIQHTIRIAAVIHAAMQVLVIENHVEQVA